jgi:transmembrane 9 superfamily member 2/4
LVPAQVHWYPIIYSVLVVLFLSLLVILILVRNVKRDIAGYNAVTSLEDQEKANNIDEPIWKLVHADVFRAPDSYPILYAVFVGTGVQIFFTTLGVICLSAVGFLSPARRGLLMIAVLIIYMLCGVIAGYISLRLYLSFRGREWQLCTILTATLYPGICFCIFLFFNIYLFFLHSSGSVPLIVILILLAMWCFIAIPLVFLGACFGYKEDTIDHLTLSTTIARAIPPPPALFHPYFGMTLAGIVPFTSAYLEFFFIMTSMWMEQFYYVFGFTLLVFLILCIICAEITVLLVYYQLCAENHRWWWFSFFTSGSAAFYTFVYSIYWFHNLDMSKMLITYLLYFGYMFLFCFTMFLVTGTVGALTSLLFVRKIFATIKDD